MNSLNNTRFVAFALFKAFGKSSSCRQMSTKSHKYSGFDLSNNYRSLVRINGPDAAPFLQNLITNDVFSLSRSKNEVIYSMILNNRGRVLFDIFVYNLATELTQSENKNTQFLVEIDTNILTQALKVFNMFKIKKKVLCQSWFWYSGIFANFKGFCL